MTLVALKSFRPQDQKGKIITLGDTFTVDDQYGRDLIRLGLAAEQGSKQQTDHDNKMLADFKDKGMPTTSETLEVRAQGKTGPVAASETPEQRSQGTQAKPAAKTV